MDPLARDGLFGSRVERDEIVEVRIAEAGVEMGGDVRARAFEPSLSTKDRRYHAGLGLMVAKQIVWSYCGSIRTKSEPSGGTGVSVDVPIEDARCATPMALA